MAEPQGWGICMLTPEGHRGQTQPIKPLLFALWAKQNDKQLRLMHVAQRAQSEADNQEGKAGNNRAV